MRKAGPSLPVAPVSFGAMLPDSGLCAAAIDTLQVNVGKLCNQACRHCHVDAGPNRTEVISRRVVDRCLEILKHHRIPALDITGGAPELVPDFRYFVREAVNLGTHVINRHNFTVMFEPGQNDLPDFFAENRVELFCSLPYFLEQQTDAQRGQGVFGRSIEALSRLNAVGYGTDPELVINLVYNPVGAFLPPEQSAVESDFKRELSGRYGLVFNRLYTITNMPVGRYLDWLRRSGNEAAYMTRLVNAFNRETLDGLMCRRLLSVDWLGDIFDCDFNQMIGLTVGASLPGTIFDFDLKSLANRKIRTGDHCFGCTAGSGSSCEGAVAG